jgi:hypothetical protein
MKKSVIAGFKKIVIAGLTRNPLQAHRNTWIADQVRNDKSPWH